MLIVEMKTLLLSKLLLIFVFLSQQLQHQQFQLAAGSSPCSLEVIANATNAQILAERAAAFTAGVSAGVAAAASIPTSFQPQLLLPNPQLGKYLTKVLVINAIYCANQTASFSDLNPSPMNELWCCMLNIA